MSFVIITSLTPPPNVIINTTSTCPTALYKTQQGDSSVSELTDLHAPRYNDKHYLHEHQHDSITDCPPQARRLSTGHQRPGTSGGCRSPLPVNRSALNTSPGHPLYHVWRPTSSHCLFYYPTVPKLTAVILFTYRHSFTIIIIYAPNAFDVNGKSRVLTRPSVELPGYGG